MDAATKTESRGGTRRLGLIFLQLLFTVVVTVFLVRRVGLSVDDVRGLDPSWWRPEPLMLLFASMVLFGGFMLSAVLWARMAAEFGGARLSPWRATSLYLTANLGRYVPGKVWQILGLAYLSRSEGIGGVTAGTAAALGQVFALGGAAVIGAGVLVGSPRYAWVALASVVLLVVITAAWGWSPVRKRALRFLSRWTGVAESEFQTGPGFGVRWAVLYTINWGIYAASFWLFARSYEPSLGFADVGPPFAAAYLLGYLFLPAPAGLGVREAILVTFLAPALGAGAVAMAVTARLWMTAVEVIPAALLAPVQLKRSSERQQGS